MKTILEALKDKGYEDGDTIAKALGGQTIAEALASDSSDDDSDDSSGASES